MRVVFSWCVHIVGVDNTNICAKCMVHKIHGDELYEYTWRYVVTLAPCPYEKKGCSLFSRTCIIIVGHVVLVKFVGKVFRARWWL